MSEAALRKVVDDVIHNLNDRGFQTSAKFGEAEIDPSGTGGFCCAIDDVNGEQLEIWFDRWRNTERPEFYFGYWSNKKSLMEARFELINDESDVFEVKAGDHEQFDGEQFRLNKAKGDLIGRSLMIHRGRNHYWFGRYTSDVFIEVDAADFFARVLQERSPAQFWEGACRQVTVNIRERDAEARRQCLRFYRSFKCQICKFDFEAKYGAEIGQRFIHVHHLDRLADGEALRRPERDLLPVCPNCHAMLHRKIPPYTPDELRGLIRKAARAL